MNSLDSSGAFGASFPDQCPDGTGVIGTQSYELSLALRAEIPDVSWPVNADEIPDVGAIMDLLEFAHAHVAQPEKTSYHSFYQHSHLTFDRDAGQTSFRDRVNRIFARNELRFIMNDEGNITRLTPPPLEPLVRMGFPLTGDGILDSLLADATRR